MQLHEIMTRDIEAIPVDATLQEAAEKMAVRDVGFLPVVENDLPVGVVTDRDIVTRCVAPGDDPRQTPVRRAMTPEVETIKEDESGRRGGPADAREADSPTAGRRRSTRRIVGVVALGDLGLGGSRCGRCPGQTLERVSQTPR